MSIDKILNRQPQIQIVPTFDKLKGRTFPIVSFVKGMTFALVDLSDAPEVLGALKVSDSPDYELDEDWEPSFKGTLYYKSLDSMVQENEPTIHTIQARMITQNSEDPGTGSACSALACFLATNEMKDLQLQTKEGPVEVEDLAKRTQEVKLEDEPQKDTKRERHVYAIQQGVEMGRLCTIAVEVDLSVHSDGSKKIANVTLSGRTNFFATGQLIPHP